jgi:POT family proton-dependent oligopeptide transporter
MYTGISVVAGATAIIFYWTFHVYDREEEAMNELGAREDPYAGKGASDESDAESQHRAAPQQQPTEKI